MTKVAILAETDAPGDVTYRAVAGDRQSTGATPGEALDALAAQLEEAARDTLVIIHNLTPDVWFTAAQQQRLAELMSRWRSARDAGESLPPPEQDELQALIDAEVKAAGERAAQVARDMGR
jgi:hypothetical protein